MTSPKPHLPILTAAAFLGAVALASLALRPSPARAEADPAGDAPATTSTTSTTKSGAPATQPGTQPSDGRVSVAVLDFASTTPGNPDLGSQIGEVLVATLSGESGFQLVDRSALARVLQEHELNATGLVGAEQAAKIGKLVGARILVTGKAFALDKQVFITAKLIGTETSLVDGIIVKGSKEADTATLVMELSQKIAERLRTAGPKLVAADEALTDPLPGLKAKLAGRKLPKVSVAITEQHVTAAQAARVDPAVETEVKNILIAAGFTVVEGNERDLDKAGVDVAITGEAFSEFNARIGNLVSCSARIELKAADRRDNRVLFSNRATTRAVDLAENTAGKTALQKGGHELGIRLLRHFAETLPPAAPGGGGGAGADVKPDARPAEPTADKRTR